MNYIQRGLQSKIEGVLFKGKVVILYGPRQVGKTTLVKELIKPLSDTAYYSCDDPSTREKLGHKNVGDLGHFVYGKKLVVIDEAQQVRDIGLTLKLLHDNYPDVQIIATGSSSFELANRTKEPLTGRSLEYTLLPLSMKELCDALGRVTAESLLETCLLYGTYPGILFGELNRQELLGTLTTQYLYKDILQFGGIRLPELLEKLLKLLAASVGNEVSYQELSNSLGASRAVVESYLRYLEQAFILYRLRPFGANIRSQLTKKQKIFFFDVGVRNALLGAFNGMEFRTDKRQLWENFVVSERKKVLNAKNDFFAKQFFLRTYDGQEVDLIEETTGPTLEAFEIKYNSGKKYTPPPVWTKNYPRIPVQVVHRDNLFEFLV